MDIDVGKISFSFGRRKISNNHASIGTKKNSIQYEIMVLQNKAYAVEFKTIK